ncbi:MAG: glycosyltransferase [Bacteroidota bacterium]|nr:glycosyltransferase [Bacteroidota bacterium]
MLSILIPVFNCDVRKLVAELHRQSEQAKIQYEILLADDGSEKKIKEQNRELTQFSNVILNELPKNIGRSKIRNLLAEKASYDFLIFMDCDAAVPSEDYIKNYLSFARGEILVCGGRIYEPDQPEDPDFSLAWKYGKCREAAKAEVRNRNPNRSFLTNNFFISKSIFSTIRFDEQLKGYGHEDTLFGYELKKAGIRINHIDNPLIHVGLEKNEEFLNKTKTGIRNLKYIAESYNLPDLFKEVKLWRTYKQIGILKYFVGFLLDLFNSLIKAQLTSKNPSLFLFDLYKLGYLSRL